MATSSITKEFVVKDEAAFKKLLEVPGVDVAIGEFSCALDSDSETFLREKALDFNRQKLCRTYLILLVGQLGKRIEQIDEKLVHCEITGNEILDYAIETIGVIDAMIPCKAVLVECSDNQKVCNFYEYYGFIFLQNDGTHNQYIKLL